MADINVVSVGLVDLKTRLDELTGALDRNTSKLATTKTELADYNSKIKEQEKAIKELQSQKDVDLAQVEAEKQKLIELNQAREMAKIAIKEQTKAVNENVALIQAGNTARDAEMGSIVQMKAELKLVDNQWQQLSATERENSSQGQALTAQSKALTDALKDQEKQVGQTGRNVGNYNEAVDIAVMSMGEMRQELKILKNMSFADKSKKDIDEIKQRIGDLTDTMGDMRAEMAVMGGPGIGAVVSGLKGIAAATEGVVASLDILGVESEVLNGLSQKMTSFIAVTQSLSEMEDLVNSGKAKAIALKIKDMAVTAAHTVASWAQVAATTAASAAQWLLNAAMAMNPIGLVVIAVAALIAGFWLLVEATGSVMEAMMWLVNPMGMVVKMLVEEYEANKQSTVEKEKQIALAKQAVKDAEAKVEATKKVIKSMEEELDTMKARGATDEQLFKQSQAIFDQKIKLAKEEAKVAEENFKLALKQGGLLMANATAYLDAKKRQNEAEKAKAKEIKDKEDSEEKARVEKQRQAYADSIQKRKDMAKKASEDTLAYEQKILDITTALISDAKDKQLKELEIAHTRELASINSQAKNANEIKKAMDAQYYADRAKIEQEFTKAANERTISAEIERQQLKIETMKNTSMEWFNASLVLLSDQMNQELSVSDLTEQEKANIREKYRQQMMSKTEEFNSAQMQAEIDFATNNGALQGQKESEIQSNVLAIKKSYYDAGKMTAKEEFDYKMDLKTQEVAREQAVKDAKVQITENAVGAAIGLLEMFDKSGKTAALAQVAFDNGKALSALVSSSMSNPLNGITGGAAGIAQFAVGAVTIASNIKKAITSINSKKPVTASAGGGSASGGGAVSAPSSVSTDFMQKYGQDQGTANNNLASSNQAVQNAGIVNALKGVQLAVAVTDIQNGLSNAQVRDSRL